MEHLLLILLLDSRFPGLRFMAVDPVFGALLTTSEPSEVIVISALVMDNWSVSGDCGFRNLSKQSGPDMDRFKCMLFSNQLSSLLTV